ncbi:TolC family protein [Niabella insulamsoli]|uniref:TolC family protein n=1 Tax=Niabella insulamsoli TaxID=3144874 RepID=UPI0031FD79A6
MKNLFIISFLFLLLIREAGAQKLTLAECYTLARKGYPAIRKMDLINRSARYSIENVSKRFLPQLHISGQASYQSETIDFGDAVGALPSGLSLPSISKDQYKVQGEISQLIYDGGATKTDQNLILANTALQQQQIETNLYQIRRRVNEFYFSILLIDAQLLQLRSTQGTIQTQIGKMEAAFENGTALRSNLDELKAEAISVEMKSTTYKSNRMAYLNMLGLFIGKELPSDTQLELPPKGVFTGGIRRPELRSFELQNVVFDLERKRLKSDYLPQVSAYVQGAYGRPTLNIIENKFGPWYMAGLRFKWSLESLYTLSNKKERLQIQAQLTARDKETFLLNTKMELARQAQQVKQFAQLIEQDEAYILLRASVTKAAEAQLSNGVITTHEYIEKVNAEDLARQTKNLHQIQLLQAIYHQQFLQGD